MGSGFLSEIGPFDAVRGPQGQIGETVQPGHTDQMADQTADQTARCWPYWAVAMAPVYMSVETAAAP